MTAFAMTNDLHHLVINAERDGFGAVFWVHSAYSYGLFVVGLVPALRARRRAGRLRARQLTTVLVGACLPTAGNLATLSGAVGAIDATALFFVGTGLLNAYAVFRQGLLGVVPAARARVLEQLEAAVVVLDEQDRLADVNAAAAALLARAVPAGNPRTGTPAAEALGGLACALRGDGGEHRIALVDGPADLDVRVTPLEDRRGGSVGRVLVVHDVTRATAQRDELSRANAVLHEQLVVIEQLRAEVAEQAVRDPLTGLSNRRHLTSVLDELVREGRTVSLVLLDVDHFKAVNDEHGHAVGDRLLQAMGERLAAGFRAGDTVVRYGGEEFVVVLPDVGEPEAVRLAEDVRRRCGAGPLAVGPTLCPTLSAGVATTGPGCATPDALLEQADRALYRAKALGRDQLVSAVPTG